MVVHLELITPRSPWMRVGQGKQALFSKIGGACAIFGWFRFIVSTLNVVLEISNLKHRLLFSLIKLKSFHV